MSKRSLKLIILLVVLTTVILSAVLFYRKATDEQNLRGTYTFAAARQNIKSIAKIVFKTPQSGDVTIYRKENAWYFKQAGDYYANTDMLTIFYAIVGKSVIVSVMPATKDILKENNLLSAEESKDGAGEGIEISIYDNEGKLLNEIIMNNVSNSNDYALARKKGSMYMYVISGVGYFSGAPSAWIPYPLLSVQPQYLKSISLEDKVYTAEELKHFNNEAEKVSKIVETAAFIDYQGIVKKDDFFASLPKLIQPREIQFNMIGGFIYIFRIYKLDEGYWLQVELANDPVAHTGVPSFVTEYQKYFSDWVFELFDENGEIFYEN